MGIKVSRELEAEILSRPGVLVNGMPVREAVRDDRPPLDITEKAFQARIVALAKQCGWLVYHTYMSRQSEPGFPDLVLTRRGEIVFAEIKTTKGRTSEAQRQWLDALGLHVPCCPHCKIGVYLWRPADWPSIVEVLM